MKQKRKRSGKRKISRRGNFTLLELIISFTLIAIAGSLLTFQGVSLFKQKGFSFATKSCRELINFCKLSATSRKEDLICHFYPTEKGMSIQISPLWQTKGQKRIYRKIDLQGVSFDFQDQKEISILFSPSGAIVPSGTLTLFTKGKREEIFIGYPKNPK